jgi:hypothetical protein
MPSPFPGMDPYLEAQPFWGDFHTAMIMAMKVALKKRVPAGYTVWSDVHVWIHEPDAKTRLAPVKPDAFVVVNQRSATGARPGTRAAGRTLAAPATTLLPAIRKTGHRYLKIKETKTDRVITVIELLSPTNKKRGEDRDDYLTKRNLYFAEGINLVELDFLRGGTRMPIGRPAPPPADYFALVCRGPEFPKIGVWPISVRDPLPDVPVPLEPEDEAVMLPLQACFESAYEAGPYDSAVDYAKPPRPPLSAPDAAWARTRIAAASTH